VSNLRSLVFAFEETNLAGIESGLIVTTLIIGCGYLGQRVGTLISQSGERVYGTVRSRSRAAVLAALGIEPVIADVLEPESLRDLPVTERIFYCVGFDRSGGAALRTVYVDGLQNVLEQLSPAVSRLVYASSTGVYGQSDGEWVDEESPTCPNHESGKVCLEAEERVRVWARTRAGSAPAVVLRFAGLYGPDRVVRRALLERGEAMPGDPEKFLNLIHIDDAAREAVAALRAARVDPLYLIVDDRPVTRRDYYSCVATFLGVSLPRFSPSEPGSPQAARDATNKRVGNHRMKRGLGAALIYPDITTGLPAALSASRRE
jgi:nucleoside-diphosphate-sugar epimerase